MRMDLSVVARVCFMGFALLIFIAMPAQAITVPGTSDPWLAGMPNGSLSNVGTPEPADQAPQQSPVFAGWVGPGALLTWTASGIVGHPGEPAGPDGASIYDHYVHAENGISDILAPINSLLGVFLGPSQPNLTAAPGTLDFSTPGSQNYPTLFPALQQVFFMGDGLTDGGDAQTIVAPSGATRLYLGTMDGYGWANNTGFFDVTVTGTAVPEPTTMLLLGSGLIGLWGARKKLKK